MKRLVLLLLLACVPLAHAVDCSQSSCSDFLCKLTGLPTAIQCALQEGTRDALLAPFAGLVEASAVFITSSPSLTGEHTKGFYELIVFIASLLFLPALLINGVRVTYSSVFSAEERFEAKEALKRTFLNMLLVWLSFDLYLLAVDFSDSVAVLIAPGRTEWVAAMGGANVVESILVLAFLVIAVGVFALNALVRWVLVYLGLFLLVLALVLETFSASSGIARALKGIVFANFVAQIVQAVFLRVAAMGFAETTQGVYLGGATRLVITVAVLAVGVAAFYVVYAASVLSAIGSSKNARMVFHGFVARGGGK